MGGRECEDGEGKRGRRCEVGFLEMVTVFKQDRVDGILSNLRSFFSFVSLFLTCRILGGHSFVCGGEHRIFYWCSRR